MRILGPRIMSASYFPTASSILPIREIQRHQNFRFRSSLKSLCT